VKEEGMMPTQRTIPDPLDGFELYRGQGDTPERLAEEAAVAAAWAAGDRPALMRYYGANTVAQMEADMDADDAAACAS
jgi:hypothetical protein